MPRRGTKVYRVGWMYLSTVLDDDSRYSIRLPGDNGPRYIDIEAQRMSHVRGASPQPQTL